MSTSAAVTNAVTSESDQIIERRFVMLANKWRQETRFDSSMQKIVSHPAYREIVGIGPAVIPLVLRELECAPNWWFAALRELTGENPVKAEHAGKLEAMANDWLAWARRNRYHW